MKTIICAVLLALVPFAASASEENACGAIDCYHFTPNLKDKASLQRGAKWFMNYCSGCHAAQYSRYERVASDLGIPEDLMTKNLIFDGSKFGSLMKNAMPTELAEKWFGKAPPDLTLETSYRSPQWVYTYLLNFYKDPSRPWGVNNRVFHNVAMPDVMLELQGLQECAPGPVKAENGGIKRDPLTGKDLLENPCGRLKVVEKGSQTPEQYKQTAYDLTNFLAYMAEPEKLHRERIGGYVMLFLGVFLVFGWLLNREYWKDVH